jgi:N-acetylmuramoyl-L-alanine amidase
MTKKIVIDPGHGGHDPGAEGFGLQEKNISLDIALKLREKLAHYADITMTRSSDVFISLSERAAIANRISADYFIAIHVNAGGGKGFESYTFTKGSAEGENIRSIVHKEVAAYYQSNGFPDRGMKKADFAVLRGTKMPSVLLENLFIDTQADALKLKNSSFRAGVAQAIAGGMIKALNLQEQNQSPVPTPTPTPAPVPVPVPPPHWAAADFARIQKAGLVNSAHDLDSTITWGEMSAVLARLLDKLKM